MKPSKFRSLLAGLILLLVGGYIGYFFGTNSVTANWQNFHVNIVNKQPPPDANVDFSLMWVVLDKLEQNYYDKQALNPQTLVNSAITGMVSSLGDPYTLYLPPTENNQFKQNLAGQFTGIGAELVMQDNNIEVMAPLDGSPAQKAGIKAADIITSVDGQSTSGWTLDQATNKIRGPKGTVVTLGVVHKGSTKPVQIKITRNVITVKSVTGWVKKVSDISDIHVSAPSNDEVAYIRLSQFGDSTNQDWTSIVNKIYSQMQKDKNIKGVVLDLRDNPGGYLTDAQFIASEFIPSGVVVQEEDGNGNVTQLSVDRKGLLTNVPVIILINKGTASAAEIVSGALHDHGRARLVGENSFGKGIVQEAEDLGNGAGLHITVAKWLTPNGTWVGNGKDGKGLTPDYTVALDPKQPTHDTQLEKAVELLVQ